MNISGNTFTGETQGIVTHNLDGLYETANKAAKKAERYNLWAMIVSIATSALLLGMALSGVFK